MSALVGRQTEGRFPGARRSPGANLLPPLLTSTQAVYSALGQIPGLQTAGVPCPVSVENTAVVPLPGVCRGQDRHTSPLA